MGNADNDLSNRCIVIQDDELVFVLLAWRAASGFGDDFFAGNLGLQMGSRLKS